MDVGWGGCPQPLSAVADHPLVPLEKIQVKEIIPVSPIPSPDHTLWITVAVRGIMQEQARFMDLHTCGSTRPDRLVLGQ